MSRDPLQPHFVVLCSNLNVEKVLPYLRQERMVTLDECELLSGGKLTTQQKREKLLIMLPRKGSNYFNNFGKCLVWSGQSELARHIGIDVSAVPPNPSATPKNAFELFQSILSPGGNLPQGLSVPPVEPLPHQQPVPAVSQRMELGTVQGSHQQPQVFPHNGNDPPGTVENKTPKVFILYCKDRSIQGISSNIPDFAKTLRYCGGLDIVFDEFVHDGVANWNKWTECNIEKSDFVLLVCSPDLHLALQRPAGSDIVHMEKASFYANSVDNSLQPPKVIPVFFQNCLPVPPSDLNEWLPGTRFKMASKYVLDMDSFAEAIKVPFGSSDEDLQRKMMEALQMHQFAQWSKLIAHLRGELLMDRPQPSNPPIPTGLHSNYISSAHPQYDVGAAEYIADTDLKRIAEKLLQDWQTLGIKLGLEHSKLEALRRNHPHDVSQAILEMFGIWRMERGREATRKTLKNALILTGYGNIAKKLFPYD